MAPQIIYLCIFVVGFVSSIYDAGKKKNAWDVAMALVSSAVYLGLLYWGGFFDVFFKH